MKTEEPLEYRKHHINLIPLYFKEKLPLRPAKKSHFLKFANFDVIVKW